jgi:hypothetical protein
LLRDAIEKAPADGLPEMQLRSLPRGGPIIDLSPHLNDFADTAAAMSQLDLAIMTDSAVAHLAAAMAKPVWLLLGHVARWLRRSDRTDTPGIRPYACSGRARRAIGIVCTIPPRSH